MNNINPTKYIGWLFLALFFGCSEETTNPDLGSIGLNYFPLQTGQYQIYKAVEINHYISSPSDTLDYLIKEEIGEPFLNLQGDTSYYLNLYVKLENDPDWKLDSIRTVRKTNYYVVVTEGNNPYIKLSFPLEEEKTWNGNAFIGDTTYQSALDEYEMIHLDEPYVLIDSMDVKSVTVVQEDVNDNCLERDDRIEIYGEGIGLLYKRNVRYFYKYDNESGCIFPPVVEWGRFFEMKLIEYGLN